MTRAEEHKRARLKVEAGVRLALEARQRLGKEHAWLEAEEQEIIVEEARLKSEEEEIRLKSEDEARIVEDSRLKSEQEEQDRLGMTNRHALPKKQGRKQRNISAQG